MPYIISLILEFDDQETEEQVKPRFYSLSSGLDEPKSPARSTSLPDLTSPQRSTPNKPEEYQQAEEEYQQGEEYQQARRVSKRNQHRVKPDYKPMMQMYKRKVKSKKSQK